MSEKELLECVRKLCKLLKLDYYHTHRSDRSPAGFPDAVIIGVRELIVVELKSAKGKPSAAQLAWLAAFERAGIEARVWRESDWHSGLIERRLKELAHGTVRAVPTATCRH